MNNPFDQVSEQLRWPPVTVVVPVHNGAHCIAQCVEALLAQDYPGPEPELVVVNNGSTDDTESILARWSDRIVLCQQPERGPSAARNCGIQRASHQLIAFTDADCIPHPNWLNELVRGLRAHPEAAFIGGPVIAHQPTNTIGRYAEVLFDQRSAIERFDPPYVITANLLARRSDLIRFGLFNQAFIQSEDVELSFRALFQHQAEMIYCPDAITDHRNIETLSGLFHKGLQHGSGSAMIWREFETELNVSVGQRMRRWQPYRDFIRQTIMLLIAHCRNPIEENSALERLRPFYAALFGLGKQLGFLYRGLLLQWLKR